MTEQKNLVIINVLKDLLNYDDSKKKAESKGKNDVLEVYFQSLEIIMTLREIIDEREMQF